MTLLFRTKANGIIWYGSLFKKLQRDVSMNAQIGQWKCQSIQYGSNVKGIFDLIKFLLKCKLQLRAWFDWGPHWSDAGAGEQGADFRASWSLNWKSYNVNLYNAFTFDVVSIFDTSHMFPVKVKIFPIMCSQLWTKYPGLAPCQVIMKKKIYPCSKAIEGTMNGSQGRVCLL